MGRGTGNCQHRCGYLPLGRAWMREARRTNNPLLRKPSGLERLLAVVGVVVLVAGVLIVVQLTFHLYAYGSRVEAQQAAQRSRTMATVASEPMIPVTGTQIAVPALASVSYPWQGGVRNAVTTVADNAAPGDRVQVWVDSGGSLTQPPRTHAETTLDAMETGALGVFGLLLLGYRGWIIHREWCLHRRSASWDAEWLHFVTDGPAKGC
jgi:hypothetical protein